MKRIITILILLSLIVTGCFSELREGGISKPNFAEATIMGCTYRLHNLNDQFTSGEKLDFVFSIINETDSVKIFDLSDSRFLFIYLKDPDNKIFYKERILSDRFFKEKSLSVNGKSTLKYNISISPEKSFTDTISAIYCQAQLTLLPKGLDYNRLSFFIKKKY